MPFFSVAPQIRGMVAAQAANIAMHTALKKKGLRDDITILVVDFCAHEDDRLPAPLKTNVSVRAAAAPFVRRYSCYGARVALSAQRTSACWRRSRAVDAFSLGFL